MQKLENGEKAHYVRMIVQLHINISFLSPLKKQKNKKDKVVEEYEGFSKKSIISVLIL